jgi:putative PIN family toxin of toxin-antitoxin system
MSYWHVLRLILDTSVIASAFRRSSGASYALLDAASDRRFVMLISPPLFFEYEDVLKRPDQRKASRQSLATVDDVLNGLAVLTEPVEIYYRWRPQLSDAKDEMVLEAAINGRADAIVTFNTRDFASAAPRFGVRVIRPAEALKEIVQ